MLPSEATEVLEIGARHGAMTRRLAERSDRVTALDLSMPKFSIAGVEAVAGNVESLQFSNDSFDCVVCTEVLEHVSNVAGAARELARVSSKYVLVGVPYRQDTRVGRTTCTTCGKNSPPYGHINSFDENRIRELFPGLRTVALEYCSENTERTNALSAWLQDLGLNPYGTYEQEEPCIFCGSKLMPPTKASLARRVASAAGARLYEFQQRFNKPLPTWILLLLQKSLPVQRIRARSPHSPPKAHDQLQ
jgi:SAM-dependent methyltransferase